MKVRRVIRPASILGTPKAVAQALGAETRRWPTAAKIKSLTYDWDKDFFFVYPEPGKVINRHEPTYQNLYDFFHANKAGQRQRLAKAGIPVPKTYTSRSAARGVVEEARKAGTKFVVRPLRHQQGRHFRVTSDPVDFREGHEYISELFAKEREYRIVYIMGAPTLILVKKVPKDAKPDEPWNHVTGEARFVTLNKRTRLHDTDLFDKLAKCPVLQAADIVGVDIMFKNPKQRGKAGEWVVCEYNTAPSLTIEGNLTKVVERIKSA